MATGSAAYEIPAGTSQQILSGTIRTDDQFTVQPAENDQIISSAGITFDSQLGVTASPGSYDVWHIVSSTGFAYYINYTLAASASVTYSVPAGHSLATLSGTIQSDPYFTQSPAVGENVVYPDALTVSDQLSISGPDGTYELWHVKLDGTAYHVNYLIGAGVGSGNATYTAGPEYTTATLDQGYDTLVYSGDSEGVGAWSPLPDVGGQLTTLTADGVFNSNGDFETELERVHDLWYTDLSGTITHTTIRSILGQGGDTTPDDFTFTALTDQPVDTLVISSAITVAGADANTDIPISASAGDTYSVSTDSGVTWSSFTSTPGFIQLGNQARIRQLTSTSNDTITTATLTIGGVSGVFSATTGSALITSPTQFNFIDTVDATPGSTVESSPVVIVGMSDGVTATVIVQGGEWAKSSDGGVTYTTWATYNGTATNGDLIKVRGTASSTNGNTVTVYLTVGSVSDDWNLTTEQPDLIPTPFTFNDIVNASVSTVYESNAITVLGITSGFGVSVQPTNCDYSVSTDSGSTWGDWTSTSGSVSLNDQIKLRRTSSSNSAGNVSCSLTVGGQSDTWTISNQAVTDPVTFWAQSIKKSNVLTKDNFGYKDYQSTRLFWVNLDDVVNGFTIASYVVDPDSDLPVTGPTIEPAGTNTSQVSDVEGNTYSAETLIGLSISGGVNGESYVIPIQFTLSSGESGERNVVLNIVDY